MAASISIRKLIEQALDEARDEFAAIVQRKLEALMGDAPIAPVRRRTVPESVPKAKGKGSVPSPKRSRAAGTHMAELRSKLLAAIPIGEPLKKSRIIELARLPATEEPRVANVLRKLKDEGVLQMRGSKAAATYTRRG